MRDFVVAFSLERWLKIQSSIATVVVLVLAVALAVLTAAAQPWLAALAAGVSLLMLPKPTVNWAVATNPSPLARPIAIAAANARTRELAAARDDVDAEDLRQLANDPVRSVREQVADVTSSTELALALAQDTDPRIRGRIIHNRALPDAEVERLAHDPVAAVRSAAAASRRLLPETLTKLATDKSAVVRWNVLVNNPERIDLARLIAEDADDMNSVQAEAQLANPHEFTAFLEPVDLIE